MTDSKELDAAFSATKDGDPEANEALAAQLKLIEVLQKQVAHYKKRLQEFAAPGPRPPVLCDTTPKASGGSYTDCF